MHFCGDEIIMIMTAIPFIGYLFHRAHYWYLIKFPKHKDKCHMHDHK